VAALLYYIYKLVKGTVAINIFIGIVIVWALWKLTELLQMKMISSMVGGFDYCIPTRNPKVFVDDRLHQLRFQTQHFQTF
jgi:DNA integrity scanning protein DisA with diadenylate cyclase activity